MLSPGNLEVQRLNSTTIKLKFESNSEPGSRLFYIHRRTEKDSPWHVYFSATFKVGTPPFQVSVKDPDAPEGRAYQYAVSVLRSDSTQSSPDDAQSRWIGDPVASDVMNADSLRLLLRDFPDKNILLAQHHFEPLEIQNAFEMALSKYNATAPFTRYTIKSFPHKYILGIGASSILMLSESFLQARNQLTYPDGGGGMSVDDKFPLYRTLAAELRQEFERMTREHKTFVNMDNMFGGSNSPYAGIGWRR